MHGMYGSMEAEYEVQRTIKRAGLTVFLCLLRKVSGPIKVRVNNKGRIDGLRRGETECIKPRAGDAHLWMKIWEEFHELVKRGFLVDVEHVKAHRTKKEKKNMSHFEKFVTEGNEKADELAKAGAMLDEGYMAEARAETIRQERERRCMWPCSMRPASTAWWNNGRTVKSSNLSRKKSGFFVDTKNEETKHRTEWCAEADS